MNFCLVILGVTSLGFGMYRNSLLIVFCNYVNVSEHQGGAVNY